MVFTGELSHDLFLLISEELIDIELRELKHYLHNSFNILPREIKVKELSTNKSVLTFTTDFTEAIINTSDQDIFLPYQSFYSSI